MAPSATMTTPDHCDGVETTLNYYLDPALGGKSSYIPGTIGSFRRKHDPHPVHIHDIRGHEADFTLNKHGFHLCKHNSALEDSTDTEQIKSIVYPEIERLLKNM
jgi:hypothetical protein